MDIVGFLVLMAFGLYLIFAAFSMFAMACALGAGKEGLIGLFPLIFGAGVIWLALKWAPFSIHFTGAA